MQRIKKLNYKYSILIPIIFFGLFFHISYSQAELVIDYGFEDWTGWNGTASPAPGYVFRQPSLDMLDDHRYSTLGTTGGGSCGGSAYEGNYFFHVQTCDRVYDPCLGRIADCVNERNFLGRPIDDAYPTGERDNTHFGTVFTGETDATLRFYFRTNGNWTSTNRGYRSDELLYDLDGGSGMKWTRWGIGMDYHGDSNNILIYARNDEDSLDPRFTIFDDSGTTWSERNKQFRPGVNWQDGNWHSFIQYSHKIDATHYEVSLWMDDWDMEQSPFANATIGVPDAGNGGYYFLGLPSNNWCATYPQDLIGVDIDKIEVWSGLPSSDITPPSAPSGLSVS